MLVGQHVVGKRWHQRSRDHGARRRRANRLQRARPPRRGPVRHRGRRRPPDLGLLPRRHRDRRGVGSRALHLRRRRHPRSRAVGPPARPPRRGGEPTRHVGGRPPAADGGPFPVVLHSHGFSGHYKLAGLHNSHVASWGHVVASVDHPERGLLGTLGLFEGDGAEDLDTRQLLGALDLLGIENDNPDSVLAGAVDSEQVATEGHSAGGRASGAAAYDDRIDAWIGQAPGPPVPADAIEGSFEDFDFEAWAADNEPPDVPSLVLAAEEDIAIPLDEIRPWFDWLAPPKRLVVLDDAGHNAFTDVCEPIQEADGIASFVEALGFDPEEVPFVRLGEDGCLADDPPAAETWAAIDHVTVAQLRWVFDREPEVAEASLETSYLDERFPGAVAENEFVG
ncbi:MAG: hypothetical protein U5R31_07145 [Acidimicrobiia bacterium]|nr:hypothetical protein [Acidimicrobiia bacterium]